jgi:Nif-specific regulatory protein
MVMGMYENMRNITGAQTPRRVEELEMRALYEISQLIGQAVNFEECVAEILRVLHDILRMERATLMLLDESGERLVIKASYGLTAEEKRRGIYRLDEGICGKIFSTRSPFVVPDIHREPLFLNRTRSRDLSKEQLSFLGVPVILRQRPVGVITVDRLFGSEVSFEEDVRFLTVVAALVAQFLALHLAIRRKEAFLREENISLKAELNSRYSLHNIIGQSKIMQEVFHAVEKLAPTRAIALLMGESGTGRELVARAIHQASPRRERPFIKINCLALAEDLLESELLGHEKGAFPGALAAKKGRFEQADGGTLFFEEVSELSLSLQAKLLRLVQEQQFERVGGARTIQVDVRVIAATNFSLEPEVELGRFRADLLFRLKEVFIRMPALRERREDIPLLLDHFLRESNKRNDRQVRLTREVLDYLNAYAWPGNVRELQNLVERLVNMADREWLQVEDLPSYILVQPAGESAPLLEPVAREVEEQRSLKEIERERVIAALRRHGWVQARAARELGLTQRQIGYRIKKYNLSLPESGLPYLEE